MKALLLRLPRRLRSLSPLRRRRSPLFPPMATTIPLIPAPVSRRCSPSDSNYAHVMIPAEANLMGFNTNAIKEAQVAYYKCANLPSAAR